ncbi:hypothetical protein GQ44DRAFT_778404 [Phaeosphaeriaceae sp. PMI808]|nr:hypothetical protein GQ44DRAFT_778404 [Phaeosphaeriaceae sp. PMI808]
MPTLRRVIRTRDVVFIDSGKDVYPQQKELRRLATVLDIEDMPDADEDVEQALRLSAQSPVQPNNLQADDEAEDHLFNELNQSKVHQALPTPEATPELDQDSGVIRIRAINLRSQSTRCLEAGRQREEISSQVDQGNIITESRRTRRLRGYFSQRITARYQRINEVRAAQPQQVLLANGTKRPSSASIGPHRDAIPRVLRLLRLHAPV